ncbi:MAG: murein biosynthesis integral membrane protein MurJ [Candidatus Sungiibacteriota bacterium]|uniref:Probable lipid II flippase MurJ n=1 Tax=Candidatus Sungiibacteriota bacterium TaxID=2750080 RepID=A0A7T5RJ08_9BACT|nr:MAG: murein biosynthesis integral membrane protein MurJ [Candidatus Sungbacteria bacterium]
MQSVNAAALLLGAAGLLSRLLGVLRDRLLAARFGAGGELDAYYAAFQIPDFLNVVFLLGAASAAVLPIFQEYLVKDREEARRLISDLVTIFLAGSLLVAALIFFLAPLIVPFIAPGFSPEKRVLTVTLTRLLLLSPVIFGISNVVSSVVQSFQRFWAYAIAPVLYNLGIILGIVVFVPVFGVAGLAFGVLAGAILHLGTQLLAVRSLGFSPRLGWQGITEGVKKVLKLSFPRVLSVSLSQLTLLILIAIGSTLVEGSISIFQLAQNLYFVPIGIFGISYSVAIFPRLSRVYIGRDARGFFYELFLGIRSIIFWMAPATVLFIVLRAHIVRVALGAGAFSWEDTRLTAAVLAVFSLSLFAGGLVSLLIKGFYALENTWRPLIINIFASVFSVALALIFSAVLGEASGFTQGLANLLRIPDVLDKRVVGLALGFSLGSAVNIWLLYGALKRLARKSFGHDQPLPLGEFLKIILAALVSGLAAYGVRLSFSETLPLITFVRVLVQGATAGVVGLATYFGILLLLKEETVFSLVGTLKRRLFRVGVLPAHWDGELHGPHPHQH